MGLALVPALTGQRDPRGLKRGTPGLVGPGFRVRSDLAPLLVLPCPPAFPGPGPAQRPAGRFIGPETAPPGIRRPCWLAGSVIGPDGGLSGRFTVFCVPFHKRAATTAT